MLRLTLLPLALVAVCAQAQSITAYRYWYDDAAASAVTTTVAPTPELMLSTTLPTGTMEPGYHRFTMQVRDSDGFWSAPHTTLFVRNSGQVNGYRYWLNDDPSTLVSASLTPGATVDLNALLATSTLDRPFNLATLQFREVDGSWSAPVTRAFSRNSGPVDGYEYWIDDEIDARVTTSISAANVVDLIADLPVPTQWGDHLFTIRFRSANGEWSVPLSSTFHFFTSIEELPGISDVLLFPNPATNHIGMRVNAALGKSLQVELIDTRGQLVQGADTWHIHGTMNRQWDISALAPGTYVLRLSDEQGSKSIPFVKE
ncbi:MAG: T9SS type A sorting domain-containing protein [Flavobacteriales bacterium]|nr:T9SS type A sorting domain-containing protein [Flavobacteriales bacterium]